jgi:hypothetical protein
MTKTTTFRYNKKKYWWFINGAIKIEGVFDDNIGDWLCEDTEKCLPRHEQTINIPEALFAEIEQEVVKAMMLTVQVPLEDGDNKVNVNR